MKNFLKKNGNITFFILCISIFAALLFYSRQPSSLAASSDNVSGWAWSENIGWISFNSTNQGGGANYGVTVASNGNMSGWAWSENIGWISFNENSGCPTTPCSPKLDRNTGVISGWARACAGTVAGDCSGATRTDSWDGWIHLKGSNYGITVSGCSWDGYGWGSDVIGWIHFKGPNYGVTGTGNACKVTQCQDNVDNDGDGKKDLADPGCSSSEDNNEVDPLPGGSSCAVNSDCQTNSCSNNICASPLPSGSSCTENVNCQSNTCQSGTCVSGSGGSCTNSAQCSTGLVCIGNVCTFPPLCSDGLDNDSDGKIDYPNDPGCASANDNDERDLPAPKFKEIKPE